MGGEGGEQKEHGKWSPLGDTVHTQTTEERVIKKQQHSITCFKLSQDTENEFMFNCPQQKYIWVLKHPGFRHLA